MSNFVKLLQAVIFGPALLLGALAIGSATSRAEEVLKIGVLEPFTGPWAKNGNECFVAMEIARDKAILRSAESQKATPTQPTPTPLSLKT